MHIRLSLLLLIGFLSAQSQEKTESDSLLSQLPSVTLHNPSNPGVLGWVAVGGVVQDRTRLANQIDVNAEVYVGLGRPDKVVGAGVLLNIHGTSNFFGERDNLGESTVSFHVNRLLLKKKLLLDVGVDNITAWGGKDIYRQYITYQRSFYFSGNYLFALGTKNFAQPFSYLSVTAGAGNGFYRKDDDYTQVGSGGLNPFFSLATPVLPRTNLVAEWNGYDWGAGLTSFPLKKLPLLLRLGLTDFSYGKLRVIASASFAFLALKKGKLPLPRPLGARMVRPARTI